MFDFFNGLLVPKVRTMRVLKLLPCLIFLLAAACSGADDAQNAQNAQAVVQAFLDAAAKGDAEKVNELIDPAERASNRFKFTPENNPYQSHRREIAKVTVDKELAVVTVRILPLEDKSKDAPDDAPRREMLYVCVKKDGKWWFSPDYTRKAATAPPELRK